MKKAQLEKYKRSWQSRREKERSHLKHRRKKAKELAQKCGRLLRDEYEVDSVYLVGSLVSPGRFHSRSDIDLLVKGLPDEEYFTALKGCWDQLQHGFELDLIPWEDAPKRLKQEANQKGEKV
jgi:predicted nucleotidyltransferase